MKPFATRDFTTTLYSPAIRLPDGTVWAQDSVFPTKEAAEDFARTIVRVAETNPKNTLDNLGFSEV